VYNKCSFNNYLSRILKTSRIINALIREIGYRSHRITINSDKFDKLITALRTAVYNDVVLDKEATLYKRYI
jgi:molybdopterin biosynthesis enzyme